MTATGIRFFQTGEHRCGYWPERTARDVLLDPDAPTLPAAYPQVLAHGFRRSGGYVYRPQCAACSACTPLRIEVARFAPNRAQRRCGRRNADLDWQLHPAALSSERFALYRRYLQARHPDGGMDTAVEADFAQFLYTNWSPTRFLEARLQGRLVAVAVTDVVDDALSAVYTFFEPGLAARSLGTAAILAQLQLAARSARPYLYLGFWIDGHPKMAYKAGFAGAQLLRDGRWQAVGAAGAARMP